MRDHVLSKLTAQTPKFLKRKQVHPNININKKPTTNKDLNKWETRLIHYEKQNDFEIDLLLNQKENIKKQYRYDLFSYKSINYEDKKDSYIYGAPT
jgi:hypothetical protein